MRYCIQNCPGQCNCCLPNINGRAKVVNAFLAAKDNKDCADKRYTCARDKLLKHFDPDDEIVCGDKTISINDIMRVYYKKRGIESDWFINKIMHKIRRANNNKTWNALMETFKDDIKKGIKNAIEEIASTTEFVQVKVD
jgi:hypothetical protein